MNTLIWPAAILFLSVALLVLEMFIPSGGILGFLSVVALIASIVVAFHNGGIDFGTGFLIVTTVVFPTMIVLAMRWWPQTPIGRRILNRPGALQTVEQTHKDLHIMPLKHMCLWDLQSL